MKRGKHFEPFKVDDLDIELAIELAAAMGFVFEYEN